MEQKSARRALAWTALACGLIGSQVSAAAEGAWPEKPVTLIVPYSAGGPTDVVARMLAIVY